MLGCIGRVEKVQSDRDGNKVDVADVGEQLRGVPGELAEAEIDIDVRVRWVQDGGLDQAGTRVQQECQLAIDGEPNTAASDVRDGDRLRRTRSTKRDGTIHRQRCAGRRWRSGIVRSLAICLDQNDGVVVVDCRAGDITVDGARGRLVGQRHAQRRASSGFWCRCRRRRFGGRSHGLLFVRTNELFEEVHHFLDDFGRHDVG